MSEFAPRGLIVFCVSLAVSGPLAAAEPIRPGDGAWHAPAAGYARRYFVQSPPVVQPPQYQPVQPHYVHSQPVQPPTDQPAQPHTAQPYQVQPSPMEPTPVEPPLNQPVQPHAVQPYPVQPHPAEPTPVQPPLNQPVQPHTVQPHHMHPSHVQPPTDQPAQPHGVQPYPVQPHPVEPTPVQPLPGHPCPMQPPIDQRVEPYPVHPQPVQPQPMQPTPVQPQPVQPQILHPVQPQAVFPTPLPPAGGIDFSVQRPTTVLLPASEPSQLIANIVQARMSSVVKVEWIFELERLTGSGGGSGVLIQLENAPGRVFVVTNWHVISGLLQLTQNLLGSTQAILSREQVLQHPWTLNALAIRFYEEAEVAKPINVWVPAGNIYGSEQSEIPGVQLSPLLGKFVTKNTALRHDDVAVLELAIQDLPGRVQPAPWGSSAEVRVGEQVIAIGHPPAGDWSVTSGIISAIREDGRVLQTDVPTGPGNSGGPLFDMYGNVIGLHTRGAIDVSFSLASEWVAQVVDQLLQRDPRNYQQQPVPQQLGSHTDPAARPQTLQAQSQPFSIGGGRAVPDSGPRDATPLRPIPAEIAVARPESPRWNVSSPPTNDAEAGAKQGPPHARGPVMVRTTNVRQPIVTSVLPLTTVCR